MAQGKRSLGVDFLTQRGSEDGAFHIVRGQGVSRQKRMDIAVFDQRDKGISGIPVKDDRRPQDPHDESVLFFVMNQLVQLVIVDGKRGFAGQMGPEGEFFGRGVRENKGLGMNQNAVLAVFVPAAGNQVAGI